MAYAYACRANGRGEGALYRYTTPRYACGNEYQCRRRADRSTLLALVFPAVRRLVRSGRCEPYSASSRL
jgi:hypothetical protein